jgi:hypothetical protein
MAYFRFQIWIQRGQIIKIYLFSSRCKTHILNLFFSVIIVIVIVPLLPFVKFAPVALLTTIDPLFVLNSDQKCEYRFYYLYCYINTGLIFERIIFCRSLYLNVIIIIIIIIIVLLILLLIIIFLDSVTVTVLCEAAIYSGCIKC